MKILKNAGTFTVLSKTENIISTIATVARTCYQSQDKSTPESDLRLVKNLVERGHTPMLEFGEMTVRFDNVSRYFTHELVRHRISSNAQCSSRYVLEKGFECIVPPHKDENKFVFDDSVSCSKVSSVTNHLKDSEYMYKTLIQDGWKPEDARVCLPPSISSQIVTKANMAEWRHIFKRRCDHFAYWEIRNVMLDLLKYCKENIPVLFDDFHFFTTKSGQPYARIVMSQKQLDDEIYHFNIVKEMK